MSVICIGLGAYTIYREKDNLNNSQLAKALDDLANEIEERAKLIEFLRDACFESKKFQSGDLTAEIA